MDLVKYKDLKKPVVVKNKNTGLGIIRRYWTMDNLTCRVVEEPRLATSSRLLNRLPSVCLVMSDTADAIMQN